MPVSELEIANSLFWLFGYGPTDPRGKALSDELRLHLSRDGVHLRTALLASEQFKRHYAALPRQPGNPPLRLDRPRLVFLHVPKCGGTTLHTILARQFDASQICPERFNGLRAYRLGELAGYTMFSGHFDLESCQALFGRRTKIITLLREPRARLVSLYYFLKIHRPEDVPETADTVSLARSLPIEDFFTHPLIRRHASVRDVMTALLIQPATGVRWESIDNQLGDLDPVMADPIAASGRAFSALRSLAAFGILERFAQSLDLISDSLGLHLEGIPPQQVTDEMRTLDHLTYAERPQVTPALLEILDDLTRADRLLYDNALQLFDERTRERHRGTDDDTAGRATLFGPARTIPLRDFLPQEGRHDGTRIVGSGNAGVLAAGPYIALRHGRYRLICHFADDDASGDRDAGFTINVWYNRSLAKCATVQWTGQSPVTVDFTLHFDVLDLEFVIRVNEGNGFALLAVELAGGVAPPGAGTDEPVA